MELSALKKLDLLLDLPPAGDDGSCDKLSMVLSDSEGRAFRAEGAGAGTALTVSGSLSSSISGSCSLNPAREDALEAERNPSRAPNVSSSCSLFCTATLD
jgi:hypothetical protein